MKNAKQYFDNHDKVEKLYFTSDNLAFFDEQNAINHSRQLEDKTITAMTRDEVDRELEDMSIDNWEEEMEELLNDLDAPEL